MKCKFIGCKKSVVIIGSCKFCNKTFCGEHRLVEDHECKCINRCRDEAIEKNALLVISGKCVANKIEKY